MFDESLECANELHWPLPLMWLASDMNLVILGGLCGKECAPHMYHPLWTVQPVLALVLRLSVGSFETTDCTSWSALFLPGTPCSHCELRAHVVPPVTDGARLLRCCTHLRTYKDVLHVVKWNLSIEDTIWTYVAGCRVYCTVEPLYRGHHLDLRSWLSCILYSGTSL